jgi:threonine aldolase
MRYVSAQLLAYIDNDLWLRLAAHANAQAAAFAEAVERHPEAALEFPVEANELFLRWSPQGFARLRAAGIDFHNWPGRDDLARLVFGHSTTIAETTALINALEH